jgi:hypothetical protein
MKKQLLRFLLAGSILFSFTGCEDLFAEDEEDMVVTDNSTYTYKYTCYSGGSQKTIQIPNRLSASCKSAWEFFARTYGCNDANNFALANSRKAACP